MPHAEERPGPITRTAAAGRATADGIWVALDWAVGSRRPSRLDVDLRVARTWLWTRALMLLLLAIPEHGISNDVGYYGKGLEALANGAPISEVLREYPLPAVAFVGLTWPLTNHQPSVYLVTYIAVMLAIDALFTVQLFRAGGRTYSTAVTLWLAAGPLLGPIALVRFDLVPGVLAGAALLWLVARPARSGVAVAIGAGLKLWPALLIPAYAAPRRTRVTVVVAAAVTGTVLLGTSVLVGGWDRLLSPLTYQSDRGLQIESVPALPLMVLWAVHRDPWLVFFGKYVSSEVAGPGDHLMLRLSGLATALSVLVMVVLWVRAWRAGRTVTPATVGWIVLTSTGLLMLSNRVFSPQYLHWLSPVAVAVVALLAHDVGARRWTVVLLVTGLITQLVYPIFYLWVSQVYWANIPGVAALAVRDLLLLGLTGVALRRSWRGTAVPRRPVATVQLPADEPVALTR